MTLGPQRDGEGGDGKGDGKWVSCMLVLEPLRMTRFGEAILKGLLWALSGHARA